jgi:Fibronectin type III domain
VHHLRLIRALWAPALVSLTLAGCGGSDVAVNSIGTTANETGSEAATPVTASATLKWVAPTAHTDGSPLADLAGYNIYYGTDSSALTQTIQVANTAALGYVISGLAKGTTWYFAVTSYTAAGVESAFSAVISKGT